MKTIIPAPADLDAAAREFIGTFGPDPGVVAFHAPMGAGKTSFIAALCRALGVTDTPNSPSFAIVNEYARPDGTPLYHFDFYRVKDPAEALDLGAPDYFFSGHTCLVEWPDVVSDMLPAGTLHVSIDVDPDGVRTLTAAR